MCWGVGMHDEVTAPATALSDSARAVFETLLVSGPLSRAELSRRLELSPASLTKISRPLVDAGIFIERGASSEGSLGRPSQPLDIDARFAYFVGIKLTGDTLYAVLTDARANVLESAEAALRSQTVDAVVTDIAAIIQTLEAAHGRPAGIGISLSGNASRTESAVRNSPFLHWKGVPLADLVSEATGIPTVLENDVRALTAAEQWFGEAAGLDSFAILTFGAGIGCGIVTNGAQIEGHQGASGLIGHLPIDDRGPLCYAGHRGCAHAFATTTGVAKAISAALGVTLLSFDECVSLARAGDPVARAVFDQAGSAIGMLVALVINLVGPDRIFLSGEGVVMYELGEEAALARMRELLHWTASEVPITVQTFGFVEWARGAAVVAVQQHVRALSVIESV
ncbi:MAG: sugar kinase [Leifsonia xyli]|nr:MAG: sugar kinase [Leifsonia xyli]